MQPSDIDDAKVFTCDSSVCDARLELRGKDAEMPFRSMVESGWGYHESTGLVFCPKCAQILKV